MGLNLRLPLALALSCLLLPAAAKGTGEGGTSVGVSVTPENIPIGMRYNGTTIRVDAGIPAGYEAAIRVMGKADALEMKRKGKVGWLVWMSVGEVKFEAVPAVYLLLTSARLTQLAPAGALTERKLGYAALASAAGWESGLYPELIKLKEEEGCFLVGEGRLVRVGSAPGGSIDRLTGSFELPVQAPAGRYAVDLFGFHDQRVTHLGSATVRLEYTGAARVLRTVAMEHGLIYGGVASVVAVLAGLFTGFVFRPKRGKAK